MSKFTAPINEKLLKKFLGDAEIEYCNFMPQRKSGGRSWEIKAMLPDASRKIIVLHDKVVSMQAEEIEIRPFANKEERNAEIYRLYTEKELSQVFLANVFGVTQPSVSIIIKQKKEQLANA